MEVDTALLPCPLCKIPHFENVHSLRATLINVATTQLVCPVCNESVMGLDKLTIHLFSHVSINIDKTENLLTEGIKEKETLNRENVDLLGTNDFQKNDFLQINERSDVINCDICDFTFTDHTILDLHQKLLHQTNPDKETGNYNFHCHLCSKKFKMRGSLIVHLRVAHFGFAKSNNEKKSNSDTSKEANKNGDSKQWECDICCKMFTTKYFLKKHKRLHTGEMPYTCAQCNKSFTFQQSYHKHMLYHSSEKPHTCNECGRSFKELSTLQNHARIHSGERPFSCETCGKCFRQRVSYLVHRRIHTGVMPYDCKVCGKWFRYKVSQRSHKCVPISSPTSNSNVRTQSTNMSFNPAYNTQHEKTAYSSMEQTERSCFRDNGNNSISKKDEPPAAKCPSIDTTDYQCLYNYSMKNNQTIDNIAGITSPPQDLYSMIMSPLLSDVESLCLTNSSTSNSDGTKNENRLNCENIFSNVHFSQRN